MGKKHKNEALVENTLFSILWTKTGSSQVETKNRVQTKLHCNFWKKFKVTPYRL